MNTLPGRLCLGRVPSGNAAFGAWVFPCGVYVSGGADMAYCEGLGVPLRGLPRLTAVRMLSFLLFPVVPSSDTDWPGVVYWFNG